MMAYTLPGRGRYTRDDVKLVRLIRYRYCILLGPIGVLLALAKATLMTLLWVEERLYQGNNKYKSYLVSHDEPKPTKPRTVEHRTPQHRGIFNYSEGEQGDDGDHHNGNSASLENRNEPAPPPVKVGLGERLLKKHNELVARVRELEKTGGKDNARDNTA